MCRTNSYAVAARRGYRVVLIGGVGRCKIRSAKISCSRTSMTTYPPMGGKGMWSLPSCWTRCTKRWKGRVGCVTQGCDYVIYRQGPLYGQD